MCLTLTALHYSVVLGADFLAVRIHFVVDLGQDKEMAGFEFVVPVLAGTSLVQQEVSEGV